MHTNYSEKTEWTDSFGRPLLKREDNIKMDLKGIEYEDMH
jgi:hypothetical protein